MSLTDFLLARIAEDEADPWRGAELIGTDRVVGQAERDALANEQRAWEARVLAECEAKRQIVEEAREYSPELSEGDNGEYAFEFVLRALASAHCDHPDFREEWRP